MTEHWTWPDTKETKDSEEHGSGVAVWEDIPTGDYSIDVTHPDYHPNSIASFTLDSSGGQPVIQLDPDARTRYDVTIRAEDEGGSGIYDVRVAIGDVTGRTDRNGEVTLQIPEGTHTITLSKDGYEDVIDEITVNSNTNEAYTLPEAHDTPYHYGRSDPPLRAWATGYYPFDVESELSDVLGLDDFGIEATNDGADLFVDGLGGLSAAHFGSDTDDYAIDISPVPLHDPAAPFTISVWCNVEATGSWQVFASLDDPSTGEHLAFGINTDNTLRVFSNDRTPNSGSLESETTVGVGEWHLATLRWDGYWLTGFVDGQQEFQVEPSDDPHEWLGGATRLTVGTRREGQSGQTSGRLDELVVFDMPLSDSQITHLYNLPLGRSTPALSDPGRSPSPVDIITDADIPDRVEMYVRIQEDVGRTGSVDNTATVQVHDGIRRNPIDQFEGGDTNRYYPRVTVNHTQLSGEESTVAQYPTAPSAYLNELALETGGEAEVVGAVRLRDETGTVHQAPVYDPAQIDNSWIRIRQSPGDTPSVLRPVGTSSSPLHARHPRTGEIVGVELTGVAVSGYGADGFGDGGYGDE
jgi:hypothetical protein